MALVVFLFSKSQTRTHIPRHILGYIRIPARTRPKTRILTTSSRGHSSWADVENVRGHRSRWRSRASSDLVCAYPQRGGHP